MTGNLQSCKQLELSEKENGEPTEGILCVITPIRRRSDRLQLLSIVKTPLCDRPLPSLKNSPSLRNRCATAIYDSYQVPIDS